MYLMMYMIFSFSFSFFETKRAKTAPCTNGRRVQPRPKRKGGPKHVQDLFCIQIMPPSDLQVETGKVVGAYSFEIECSHQTS
jgi:hypothetical protein